MNKFGVKLSGAIVLAVALVLSGVTSASAAPGDDVVKLTNAERTAAGKPVLKRSIALDAAAQEWANVMSSQNQMVHSSAQWRAARIPSGWTSNGENIAYGYSSAGSVVSAWMTSTGHRDNILRSSYTHLGVGYVASGNYWVQIFGGYAANVTLPAPTRGPWPLYRPSHLSTIYELVTNANGSQTPKPIDGERWRTVYGSEIPDSAPTSFVKYPWSPTVYAVTFWPGGDGSWQWDKLTFDQWKYAGNPSPRTAGWISGSEIYKWGNSADLFLKGEDGVVHRLTFKEWSDTGNRSFQARANQGYIKLTWNGNIAFDDDLSTPLSAKPVDFPGWSAAGYPSPVQATRFTGDAFYKTASNPTIYYSGPTFNGPLSYKEWSAAGSPTPEIRAGS